MRFAFRAVVPGLYGLGGRGIASALNPALDGALLIAVNETNIPRMLRVEAWAYTSLARPDSSRTAQR